MYGVLLLLASFSFAPSPVLAPQLAHAEVKPVVVSIDQLITDAAKRHHLNREHLYRTLECESAGFTDVAIQSFVPDTTGPNGRENSWGVAQFHLPSGLTTSSGEIITKEIAIDPEKAIDAAAYQFSIGNASQWSCYNKLYASHRME